MTKCGGSAPNAVPNGVLWLGIELLMLMVVRCAWGKELFRVLMICGRHIPNYVRSGLPRTKAYDLSSFLKVLHVKFGGDVSMDMSGRLKYLIEREEMAALYALGMQDC